MRHAVNNELIMQPVLDTTKDERRVRVCVCVSLCAYQSCHFFLLLSVLQKDSVRRCVCGECACVCACVCVKVHVQRLVSLDTTTVQAIE